jgi:hypothetical protein
MRPPRPRRPLRLGEVQDAVALGILQVVRKTELDLAIDAAVGAPPCDPCTASGASAIADMKALLDHAPIGFGAGGQAQARAARCQSYLADGAGHENASATLPTPCLLSVPEWCRTSVDAVARNPC